MFVLFHDDENCTGRWEAHFETAPPCWECTGCSAAYASSPEVRRAAEEENRIGALLSVLELEGREML